MIQHWTCDDVMLDNSDIEQQYELYSLHFCVFYDAIATFHIMLPYIESSAK